MDTRLTQNIIFFLSSLVLPQVLGQTSVNTFVNVECQDERADISMMFPGKISGQVRTITQDITQTCVFGVKEVESFSFAIPLDSCGTTKENDRYHNSLNITYFDTANRVYSVVHDYTCDIFTEKTTTLKPDLITSKDVRNDASVNMSCIADGIKVAIEFHDHFDGVIYTEEKADRCIFQSGGKPKLEFLIPVDSCGTTYNGDFYKNIIIIEYPNQFYGAPASVRHKVQCRYTPNNGHRHENNGQDTNRQLYEDRLPHAKTERPNYRSQNVANLGNYRTDDFRPAKVELKCYPNYMEITLVAIEKLPKKVFARSLYSSDTCNFSISSDLSQSSFRIPLTSCGTQKDGAVYQATLMAEYVRAFGGKPLLVKHNLRCRYIEEDPVIEGIGFATTKTPTPRARTTRSSLSLSERISTQPRDRNDRYIHYTHRPIQRAYPPPDLYPTPKVDFESQNRERSHNLAGLLPREISSLDYKPVSLSQNELIRGRVKDAAVPHRPEARPSHNLTQTFTRDDVQSPVYGVDKFKAAKQDLSLQPKPYAKRQRETLLESYKDSTGGAEAILPTSIEPVSLNPADLSQTQFVTPLSVGIEAGIPSDMEAPEVKTRCQSNGFRIFIHFPQVFSGKIKNKANTCKWSGNATYEMALSVPFESCDTTRDTRGSHYFPFEIEYYSPDLPLVVGRTLHKAECGPQSGNHKILARVDPVANEEISIQVGNSGDALVNKNLIRRSSRHVTDNEEREKYTAEQFRDSNNDFNVTVSENIPNSAEIAALETTPVTNFQGALECRKRDILVTLYFRQPFQGIVYSESNISRCNFPIKNMTRRQIVIIPLDGCGTTKLEDEITYSNVLIIEYPKWEFPHHNNRVKQEIKCEYSPIKDEIPNIIPQIKHECRSNSMKINIKFEESFMGAIYTAQEGTKRCYFSLNVTNTYNLEIPLDQCGTVQEGSKYSNKIIIDYGLIKESRHVSCLYSGLINFTIDP